MLLENFQKFINYYGNNKVFKIICFTCMSLLAGCFEFFGIALIYPFILMLINPESVNGMGWYKFFIEFTGVTNSLYGALILGGLALLLFIFKNIYMILFTLFQSRFIAEWRRDISNRFMGYFLYASYKDIIRSSNSDKYYIINILIQQAMINFVVRILILFTNLVIVLLVAALILWKFPLAGSITIIFAFVSLFLQNMCLKNATAVINNQIQKESLLVNELTCSNIDNIKEIKISNAEDFFYENYVKHSKKLSNLDSMRDFYTGVPPYVIETFIVCSMLIIGFLIAYTNMQNQSVMVASFAIVVASIFRIAPALGRIQTSLIHISAGRSYIKTVNNFYEEFKMNEFKYSLQEGDDNSVTFEHEIELKNISFSYKNGENVLKNISLKITKGDFVGIIGLSGSGKTTLADVMMGLLPPDSGKILVDGIELTDKNYKSFRDLIGYVPQEVKILGKSFKENVAWGEKVSDIDEVKVKHAIEASKLCDLVSRYEEGINACPFVGTNGLSQGQKQRIAIARALYKDPEIIILDEATSALDTKVEHEITDTMNNFISNKTIIAIAHRLSTLKKCNKLVYIKEGYLVDVGTFDYLAGKYEEFENLLKLSSIN